MELDKTEFQLGENVTIRLSLKNIGNETVSIRWVSRYSDKLHFDFYVLDENNTQIFQYSEVYGVIEGLEFSVNPGGQLTSVYVWYQETGYPEFAQVPKGIYYVRGSSRSFLVSAGSQVLWYGTLETPTITITIT
jgi:hypothetical protein